MSGNKILVRAITFNANVKFPVPSSFNGVFGCGINGPIPTISAPISLKNRISSAKDSVVCSGKPTRHPVPTS